MSAKKSWLTRDELNKFRKALLEKGAELAGDVSLLEDQALRGTEDDVSVDHMADHGSESFDRDQTIGLVEGASAALRAIQDALKKMGMGEYGLCEECGEKIKKARLRALPYARLCLECKMAEEGS